MVMVSALGGALLVVVSWSLLLAYRDFTEARLPDPLTVPPAMVGFSALVLMAPGLALAGLAWPGLYLALGLWRGGIGGGDIKLGVSLGALCAAAGGLLAVVGAMAVAALLSALGFLAHKRVSAPHGPAMLAAAFMVVAGVEAGGWPIGHS